MILSFFGHMDGNREVLFCDKNNMRRKNLIDPNHSDKQHATHPEACQSHQGYSSAGLQNGQEVGDRTKKNILGGKICIEPLFLKKREKRFLLNRATASNEAKHETIIHYVPTNAKNGSTLNPTE